MENNVLPQEVPIGIKFKSGMRSHIRHSEEGKKYQQEGNSIKGRVIQNLTSGRNECQSFEVKNTPRGGIKRGVNGNASSVG